MRGLLFLLDRTGSDRICGGTPQVHAAPPTWNSQCISQTNVAERFYLTFTQKGKFEYKQEYIMTLVNPT